MKTYLKCQNGKEKLARDRNLKAPKWDFLAAGLYVQYKKTNKEREQPHLLFIQSFENHVRAEHKRIMHRISWFPKDPERNPCTEKKILMVLEASAATNKPYIYQNGAFIHSEAAETVTRSSQLEWAANRGVKVSALLLLLLYIYILYISWA